MVWKVAAAKERFSEVLRRAASKPQLIHNRDRLVGVVLGADEATSYLSWRERAAPSIEDALAEARRICREEGEDLEIEPRADRPNPVLAPGGKPLRARRHQRRQ